MNQQPRLQVKPVVFYPKGVAVDPKWVKVWRSHLQAARQKYLALLHERDTFDLADELLIAHGQSTIARYMTHHYRTGGPDSPTGVVTVKTFGYEPILAELLSNPALNPGGKFHRYNFPYCLAVLLVDPNNRWHAGGGRNFNGGLNEGAGFFIIPTRHLALKQLQSTVIHELGHAFGLVHVQDRAGDLSQTSPLYQCYYDVNTSPSIMSYNLKNHSNALTASQIPGCLLGDELDALSKNRRVFPNLFFNGQTDFAACKVGAKCPPHDGLSRQTYLGPMDLMWCYSDDGALFCSKVQNLNDTPQRRIRPNTAAVGFDPTTMWHSGTVNAKGWVSLEVTFPIATTLDRVQVYSQHSGQFHRAEEVQIEVADLAGKFQFVARVEAKTANTTLKFAATAGHVWKLAFRGKSGGHVVIRGLRFFIGQREWYPPADVV